MTLAKSEGMETQKREFAAPPDDGGHIGVHTQLEQTVLGQSDRDAETESIESLGKTPLQPNQPNSGLVWFWAAIAAFSIGLIVLARAFF